MRRTRGCKERQKQEKRRGREKSENVPRDRERDGVITVLFFHLEHDLEILKIEELDD